MGLGWEEEGVETHGLKEEEQEEHKKEEEILGHSSSSLRPATKEVAGPSQEELASTRGLAAVGVGLAVGEGEVVATLQTPPT